MYAWSPNWKLNAKGSDHYELYVRRSFDGGKTWTTTPSDWGGQGTTTCEYMRDGGEEGSSAATQVCTTYLVGADEQARNVSPLSSGADPDDPTATNKFTVLDPRYAPAPATMPSIEDLADETYTDPEFDDFNPSRFFVVFETGDNTTVADGGEAEALDLNFGRGVNYGDYYQTVSEELDMLGNCSTDVMCNEFQRLNTGQSAAEEASLAMGPSGNELFSAWAQVDIDVSSPTYETAIAAFGRVWYDDLNFVATHPDYSAIVVTDEPVIGDTSTGGPAPPSSSGGSDSAGDDDDDDNFFGCSVGQGKPVSDPLLPGMLLVAFGYLALRRRMAGTTR
jgi:hypothetical protein